MSSSVRVGLVRIYVVGLEIICISGPVGKREGVKPNGTTGPADGSQTLQYGNHPRMGNTSGI